MTSATLLHVGGLPMIVTDAGAGAATVDGEMQLGVITRAVRQHVEAGRDLPLDVEVPGASWVTVRVGAVPLGPTGLIGTIVIEALGEAVDGSKLELRAPESTPRGMLQ